MRGGLVVIVATTVLVPVAVAGAIARGPRIAGAVGDLRGALAPKPRSQQLPLVALPEAQAGAPTSPDLLWTPVASERDLPQPAAPDEDDDAGETPVPPLGDYPGDLAGPVTLAHWMGGQAGAAGLPPELPVMAALVESDLRNIPYGDRDSVGFFQMRLGLWNDGPYGGYLRDPQLQMDWFIDQALEVRAKRVAAGDEAYGTDAASWGEWIADVERPAHAYRDRYQLRLDQARALLETPAPFLAGVDLGTPLPGRGHVATELARRVLASPRVTVDADGIGDLRAGRIDPRVSLMLLTLSQRYPVTVSVFQTGHSYLTAGGGVSNHSHGRGGAPTGLGGELVRPGSAKARRAALLLGAMPAVVRSTEIGAPWLLDGPEYFTDSMHQDHLHVGWDNPLDADAEAYLARWLAAAGEDDAPAEQEPAAPAKRPAPEAEAPAFQATGDDAAERPEGEPQFTATTPTQTTPAPATPVRTTPKRAAAAPPFKAASASPASAESPQFTAAEG